MILSFFCYFLNETIKLYPFLINFFYMMSWFKTYLFEFFWSGFVIFTVFLFEFLITSLDSWHFCRIFSKPFTFFSPSANSVSSLFNYFLNLYFHYSLKETISFSSFLMCIIIKLRNSAFLQMNQLVLKKINFTH